MSKNTKGAATAPAPPPKISFAFSFLVIAVIALAANIVQVLADRWIESSDPMWYTITLVAGGGFALATAVLALIWRRLTIRLFASLRFAAAVVAVLALATVAGTMILQGQSAEEFEKFYGGLTGLLRALHTDDLFHSFWYMALLGLTAISLTVDALLRIRDIATGKRDGWVNAGFILTHFGIVLSLLGGLFSMLGGEKGMVHLTEGRSSATYVRSFAQEGEPTKGDLPFAIRLDDFEVEHYADAYSLYIYKLLPGVTKRGGRAFNVLGALDSKAGEHHRFAGDYELAVVEVLEPDRAKPDAAPTKKPHAFALDGKPGAALDVGESASLGGGVTLKVLRFLPHFNFDLKTKQAISLSDHPENPAVEVVATNDETGETLYQGWLFASHPGFSMDGHGGPLSKRIAYRYHGAAHAHGHGADPVPTLVLRLTRAGEEVIPPFRQTVGQPSAIPVEGGNFAVAYAKKGDRIKQYHSTISLLKGDREVVTKHKIKVNHPLWQDGWALYQANYDPKNPRYSGIQVVKDPGLTVVYAGLIIMGLGVIHILYLRRRRPGRKRKEKTEATGGASPSTETGGAA